MPTYSITEDPSATSTLLDALAGTPLVKSRREARTIIEQGGLYLNDQRVTDPDRALSEDDLLHGRYLWLRLGKRNHFALVFNHG